MERVSKTTADCQDNDQVLADGWKAVVVENNRWFYLHDTKKNCCWLPPAECWQSRHNLPYGWEQAESNDGRRYFINHLTKETVRCLPSPDGPLSSSMSPRTRKVVISRHSDIGYGFVAGSEKPVLIRSVAEDGPSAGKLHANDQILKINGEDVYNLPQSDVILRIKQYTHELCLEVIANDDVQDVKNQGQRKSSIMSRTTRERRRSNPVNVRFAEAPVLVHYVGSPPAPHRRSSLPLIPNVLKIFLENGQTRSFLYNSTTTVKDLFYSLCEKVGVKKRDRFSLVLQATQTLNESFVQFNERVSQIYLKRNCSSSTWLCKLLVVFAPKDVHFLLKEDPVAFDYFYKQMCSQVVEGRFGWELKYETAIKLAALHLQQYALEDKVGKGGKISVKAIEKEVGGLDNFVPNALINTMQRKDLQRVLSQQIKQSRNLCPPGQKYISPLQAKLQYLKICSEMKTYGGRQFNAVIVDPTEDPKIFQDQKLPSVIFVGPNVGLAQVTNPRSFSMLQIAEFSQINGIVITPHTEGKQNLKIFLTNAKSVTLILGPIFETRDLVYLISGYCKYSVENARPLSVIDMTTTENIEEPADTVPSYANRHLVVPDTWSYKTTDEENNEDLKGIDFLQKPTFANSERYSIVNSSTVSKSSIKQQVCNGSLEKNFRTKSTSNQSLQSIQEDVDSKPDDIANNADGSEVRKNPRDSMLLQLTDTEVVKVSQDTSDVSHNIDINYSHDDNQVTNQALAEDSNVNGWCDSGDREQSPTRSDDTVLPFSDENTRAEPNVTENGKMNGLFIIKDRDQPLSGNIDDVHHSHSNKHLKRSDLPENTTEQSSHHVSTTIPQSRVDNSALSSDSSLTYSSDDSTALESPSSEVPQPNGVSFPPSAIILHTPLKTNDERSIINNTHVPKQEVPITVKTSQSAFPVNNHHETDDDEKRGDFVDAENAGEEVAETVDSCDGNLHTSTQITLPAVNEEGKAKTDNVTEAIQPKDKGVSDQKPEAVRRRRRLSSGYIPSLPMNGPVHGNIHTPEFVIHDTLSSNVGHGTLNENDETLHNSEDVQMTSRTKACDHVLKQLYSLKTKLTSLLHVNHSLRTNNEILRTRKQLMMERVSVLEECAKQIEQLIATDEKRIIDVVLQLSSALSSLAESCMVLFNAQYSMKHFTSELVELIDRHIDVLITTDTWSSSIQSDLTMELHRDKCDLLCSSLAYLRKIINNL